LERHFCHAAALAASRAEHFALAAATAAEAATAAALCFTRSATIGTTVRLVLKALSGKKFLLAGRERELARTIDAVQKFVLVY
jgi:hypothetical protein